MPALIGSAATSAAGSASPGISVGLTGQSVAAAAGALSPTMTVGATGSAATISIASVPVVLTPILFGYPSVPEDGDEREHRRKLARAVNGLLLGHMNCTLDVTLTAGTATTTIQDSRISAASVITPAMPVTASAAAAVAAGIYVTGIVGASGVQTGSAVIHHNNTADTDKTVRLLIVG